MIGLIDIDSKMSNLALMKIKSYYKNKCNWYDGFSRYDKVYISKIFNFSKDWKYYINTKDIIRGGTGCDIKSKLPEYIENCQPDYSIYPDCNYSLQKYTSGCIRNCKFCIVRKKEGYLKNIEPMNLNPKGKWIYLLDNNFFASNNWYANIKHLQSYNQKVQFEGIDLRLLTDEMIIELSKIKVANQTYHTAWDNPKENLTKQIEKMLKHIKSYKIMIYVLIGFNSTFEEDYYRVMKIKELGCKPFIMPYNKNNIYQKRFARWVNNKAVFYSTKWEDYK
jgi:hypothetical protein